MPPYQFSGALISVALKQPNAFACVADVPGFREIVVIVLNLYAKRRAAFRSLGAENAFDLLQIGGSGSFGGFDEGAFAELVPAADDTHALCLFRVRIHEAFCGC